VDIAVGLRRPARTPTGDRGELGPGRGICALAAVSVLLAVQVVLQVAHQVLLWWTKLELAAIAKTTNLQ
jgi:hypothetical protein